MRYRIPLNNIKRLFDDQREKEKMAAAFSLTRFKKKKFVLLCFEVKIEIISLK